MYSCETLYWQGLQKSEDVVLRYEKLFELPRALRVLDCVKQDKQFIKTFLCPGGTEIKNIQTWPDPLEILQMYKSLIISGIA